jgi:1-acyl-sn-glycerol-3-phosphate acyltransferase
MMAGCLFVERRNRASLQKEIGELQEGLERGLTVTIFPEATSTNGEQILRFRRPLFMAAGMASKPVIPICLNYRTLGGETLTKANRDSIFWYGDMDFLPHLWKLCGIGQAEVDVHFIEVIRPSAQQEPGELAAASQAAVESVFRPLR